MKEFPEKIVPDGKSGLFFVCRRSFWRIRNGQDSFCLEQAGKAAEGQRSHGGGAGKGERQGGGQFFDAGRHFHGANEKEP